MDVVAMGGSWHALILRIVNAGTQKYHVGLAQAARAHRTAFGARLVKRWTRLDITHHVVSHADMVVLGQLNVDIAAALSRSGFESTTHHNRSGTPLGAD